MDFLNKLTDNQQQRPSGQEQHRPQGHNDYRTDEDYRPSGQEQPRPPQSSGSGFLGQLSSMASGGGGGGQQQHRPQGHNDYRADEDYRPSGQEQQRHQQSSGSGFLGQLSSMAGGGSGQQQHRPSDQEYRPAAHEQQQSGGGLLGQLSSFAGGGKGTAHNTQTSEQKPSGGGGIMGALNSFAGGGAKSEKQEDALDKGVDWVQEHVLGQGPQNNESALEQAKDEKISDFIRDQYKKTTGSELPIKDKERRTGFGGFGGN